MVKTTKVSVLSGSTTSETVRMKTFADNDCDLGSTTPRLLKLLTVFCVGQAIVVIVASIVVGVFLQSQVSLPQSAGISLTMARDIKSGGFTTLDGFSGHLFSFISSEYYHVFFVVAICDLVHYVKAIFYIP